MLECDATPHACWLDWLATRSSTVNERSFPTGQFLQSGNCGHQTSFSPVPSPATRYYILLSRVKYALHAIQALLDVCLSLPLPLAAFEIKSADRTLRRTLRCQHRRLRRLPPDSRTSQRQVPPRPHALVRPCSNLIYRIRCSPSSGSGSGSSNASSGRCVVTTPGFSGLAICSIWARCGLRRRARWGQAGYPSVGITSNTNKYLAYIYIYSTMA